MNKPYPAASLAAIAKKWSAFQSVAGLTPIRNQADYDRIRALADALADEVGDDEHHPLFSLFDLAMTLMQQWEDAHIRVPAASPREVLRFLIEEHNLKQKDLEDIASPAHISDILAGRREISKRVAHALAERFNVNVAAFI